LTLKVFAVSGLVGPLVRWATWPLAHHPYERGAVFIYRLVFLLWPAQPLAPAANTSLSLAALGVVVLNVALFVLLGVMTAPFAKRPVWLLVPYAVVCVLLVFWELVGAGFDEAFVNYSALAAAIVLYSLPFWIVARKVSSLGTA
jgi:hypothetical protein